MDIIDLLAGDSFIIFNKNFAKMYGLEEAVLLGAMCGYQKGFRNEEFYREQEKILEDTTLTLYSLRKSMKNLQNLGIIEINKRGIPAKLYYKINTDKLCECLSSRTIENDRSGCVEIYSSSECEIDSTIYNNNKQYKNKNKNNNKERKTDVSYDTILSEKIEDDNLRNAFYEFIKMRKLVKKPMTDRALQLMINKLYKISNNTDEAIKILEQSIINNWQDVYPLKDKYKDKNNKDWMSDLDNLNETIMSMF